MIKAKREVDASGLSKRHILVITDGENTKGYTPEDVTRVISNQTEKDRASIYFVAFDVVASKFNAVRDSGGVVLAASNETDLKGTLDYLLTGKILAEQPVRAQVDGALGPRQLDVAPLLAPDEVSVSARGG